MLLCVIACASNVHILDDYQAPEPPTMRCTPNGVVMFCRDALADLSQNIRYTLLENPAWEDVFTLTNGDSVPDALDELAERIAARLDFCPCVGPCTMLDTCEEIPDEETPNEETPLERYVAPPFS